MLERLKANRDFCLDALREMPRLTVPRPEGAFYLFPRDRGADGFLRVLQAAADGDEGGFAPGVAFGAGGEGSIRICYAADRDILEPAMERLGQFLNTLRERFKRRQWQAVSSSFCYAEM